MKRSRFNGILVINWLGYPYRYLRFDQLLTLLEGANGAGKTTFLTSVYTAMMPDMSLVKVPKVTNDGTREATPIHGMLTGQGPSYSIMDMSTATGERILAGVQLDPRQPPKVDATMFLIFGASAKDNIHGIFQGEEKGAAVVPTLADIRENAGKAGLTYKQCGSLGEYGKELFDAGLYSVNIGEKDKRRQYNDLLLASLTGALSSNIQQAIKNYLLAEDTNARDSISRMQENLRTCRNTKSQIATVESRLRVIEGVYNAGLEMIVASATATRLFFQERESVLRKNVEECCGHRKERDLQADAMTALRTSLNDLLTQKAKLTPALEATKTALKNAEDGLKLAQEIVAARKDLEKKTDRMETARQTLSEAETEATRTEEAVNSATKRALEVAQRLSDVEQAYEGVGADVAKYRRAVRALEDVRTSMGDVSIQQTHAETLLQEIKADLSQTKEKIADTVSRLQLGEDHLAAFTEGLQAVRRVRGQETPAPEAYRQGESLIQEAGSLAVQANRVESLRQELNRSQRVLAERQKVLGTLAPLVRKGHTLNSSLDLQSFHKTLHSDRETTQKRIAQYGKEIASHEKTIFEKQPLLTQEEKNLAKQQEARNLAEEIGGWVGNPIGCSSEVEAARRFLNREKEVATGRLIGLENQRLEVESELSDLRCFGEVSGDIVNIREEVGGVLVADLYKDVPIADAARQQALLGAAVNGIIVDDLDAAAKKIARIAQRPDDVFLFRAGKNAASLPEGESLEGAVLVKDGQSARISRLPETPVLGVAARQQRIDVLERRLDELDARKDEARELENLATRRLEKAETLARLAGYLDQPDIARVCAELSAAIKTAQGRVKDLRAEQTLAEQKIHRLEDEQNTVSEALPLAGALDQPHVAEVVANLTTELEKATKAKAFLETHQLDIDLVKQHLITLRQLPVPPSELDSLRNLHGELVALLRQLNEQHAALDDLLVCREGFAYEGQVAVLEEKRGALASLRAEKDEIDSGMGKLTTDRKSAQATRREADRDFMSAQGDVEVALSSLTGKQDRFAELGTDGTQDSVDRARALFDRETNTMAGIETAEVKVRADLSAAEANHGNARKNSNKLRPDISRIRSERRSLRREWIDMVKALEQSNQAGLILAERFANAYASSVAARQMAKTRVVDLIKNLDDPMMKKICRDESNELLASFQQEQTDVPAETETGWKLYLRHWLKVVAFIQKVVPQQYVRSTDPMGVMRDMREAQSRLIQKLEDQEDRFRTSSRNVAKSILQKLSSEQNRITKLSTKLSHVVFGNITGAMIKFERRPDMIRLLELLRDEPGLFEESAEDVAAAMKTVYEKHFGGSIKEGSVLDYRSYADIKIYIRRKGKDKPEVFGPLSTGEGIGVGAAILMVILDVWEQQTNSLRQRGSQGCLRFLFLDEANRLDPKSQATLADLCKKMQIQLLIAAPVVDRYVEGTTYHLTRIEQDGRDIVKAVGRRQSEASRGAEAPVDEDPGVAVDSIAS